MGAGRFCATRHEFVSEGSVLGGARDRPGGLIGPPGTVQDGLLDLAETSPRPSP